jgi:hypothetical protein
MVRRKAGGCRQLKIKELVHVAEDEHVGVQEDEPLVTRQSKDKKLRPCVSKALCDELAHFAGRVEGLNRYEDGIASGSLALQDRNEFCV